MIANPNSQSTEWVQILRCEFQDHPNVRCALISTVHSSTSTIYTCICVKACKKRLLFRRPVDANAACGTFCSMCWRVLCFHFMSRLIYSPSWVVVMLFEILLHLFTPIYRFFFGNMANLTTDDIPFLWRKRVP